MRIISPGRGRRLCQNKRQLAFGTGADFYAPGQGVRRVLYEGPGLALDAKALRRDLKALAFRKSDRNELRKEALALIKNEFLNARERVKQQVLGEKMGGQAAARAIAAIQDSTIQVLFDFAVKRFYPA